MKFKSGVDVTGLHPMMDHVFRALLSIEIEEGYEATITAGREGKHSAQSSHYAGNALDVRIRDLPDSYHAKTFVKDIESRLPIGFQVFLERDHVHVQYRPKIGEVRPV